MKKMYCYFVFFPEALGLQQDATWHLDGLLKTEVDLSLPLFSLSVLKTSLNKCFGKAFIWGGCVLEPFRKGTIYRKTQNVAILPPAVFFLLFTKNNILRGVTSRAKFVDKTSFSFSCQRVRRCYC